jgi:hypothetical protein
MKSHFKKILFILILFVSMLGFAANTNAALSQIEFTGMQAYRGDQLGELYYTWRSGALNGTSSYSYCIDFEGAIGVPGNYYAQTVAITGAGWPIKNGSLSESQLLKAAWLIDTYAVSKNGVFGGYNAFQIGAAVQMAIWKVTGQLGLLNNPADAPANLFVLADTLYNTIPAGDLSSLKSKYVILDVYDDVNKTNKLQSQLTPTSVPIPATVWLLGAGLLGIGYVRKKVWK